MSHGSCARPPVRATSARFAKADKQTDPSQMLFTWDTTNLCIVFERWHIRSTAGLIFSLLAVVAIGAGYEALRESIRRYEHYLNKKNEAVPRKFWAPLGHASLQSPGKAEEEKKKRNMEKSGMQSATTPVEIRE